jgi:hypothetical protein
MGQTDGIALIMNWILASQSADSTVSITCSCSGRRLFRYLGSCFDHVLDGVNKIGLLATGMSCSAEVVIGRSLVPCPPERIRAFIEDSPKIICEF